MVLDIPVLQKEKLKCEHIHLEEERDPDNRNKSDLFQKLTAICTCLTLCNPRVASC